jgi:hypothetical protein
LDCLTFLTAIGFFVLLKDPKVVPSSDAEFEYNFLSTLGEMLSVRATRTALFLIVFSQAVFQGAYSALVTYAPIKQYGLGLSGVGFYQLAASLGIISGFLVVWFAPRLFSRHNSDLLWLTVFIAILGCAFVFLTVSANSILLSLFSFYIFNALFECIWLHYSAEFFRASPTGRLGRYQFVCTSLAALTMSLMTLLYTTAIHLWGGAIGVAIVMGTALILIIVIGFFSNFLPAAKEV